MKQHLEEKLKLLESETDTIYRSLDSLSEQELTDKSYGWSLVQVLAHLEMTERGSVMYMKKKMMAGDKMGNLSIKHRLRLWFGKYFMQSNLKWKAPKVVGEPPADHSYQEMKSKWSDTRKAIGDYIKEYPEHFLNKTVYKHPIAGRQNLAGALDCFIYHQRHHIHQIRRIKKRIGA
ncbi:MAG: hypothetical protein Tsb0034_24960 [Ekhidna sp.]